jgi:hypothetical protein
MRGADDQLIILHRYLDVAGEMQLLQQRMRDADTLGVADADDLGLDAAS